MVVNSQLEILLAGENEGLAKSLELFGSPETSVRMILPRGSASEKWIPAEAAARAVILLAPDPDRDESERWLVATRQLLAEAPVAYVVLLSSLEVYSPDHHSVGMVDENAARRPALSNARAEFWEEIEAGVGAVLQPSQLLILRAAHVIGPWANSWFNRLLHERRAVTVMGYDPAIQLIHESDFVRAVEGAIGTRLTGIYNLAPRDALPLRKILRAAAVRRLPVPWALLRLGGEATGSERGASPAARFAFLRYSCTGCGERFEKEVEVGWSSIGALEQFLGETKRPAMDLRDYSDPHGLDIPFIHRSAGSGLKFLEKTYWRIERKGFEHIPEDGPAILVGPHRGFMPLDAVMVVEMVTKYTGRAPRFLLHPTLVKFGILARFMRRLGGVMACKKNADDILERGELLGVYPEGISGAFKHYKEVYDLGRFGRPDYAKFALKHGAPVVPFVIVGCAEIFPILAKLKWKWVKKHIEWPCLPITPTFPFLPVPLPSKWHLQILPPVHPAHAIEAAGRTGREPYQVIVEEVKKRVEEATSEMLRKRKSIFFGKLFDE